MQNLKNTTRRVRTRAWPVLLCRAEPQSCSRHRQMAQSLRSLHHRPGTQLAGTGTFSVGSWLLTLSIPHVKEISPQKPLPMKQQTCHHLCSPWVSSETPARPQKIFKYGSCWGDASRPHLPSTALCSLEAMLTPLAPIQSLTSGDLPQMASLTGTMQSTVHPTKQGWELLEA